jgi:predicted transcriptional regulator
MPTYPETVRRGHGQLEADVLAELWRSGEAMTPQEVRDRLPGDLAYTTVMTILTRLYEKGLAVRERDGRAYRYRAAQDAAEFAALRMQQALEAGQDREAVLTRFVTSLSADDSRVLADALRRPKRRGAR